MSRIIVNGKDQEIELPLLLIDLIRLNDVQQPEMVSIQINQEFVDSDNFDSTQIVEGDEVEFLYFMGGGSRC